MIVIVALQRRFALIIVLLTVSCNVQENQTYQSKFSRNVAQPITQAVPDLMQAQVIQIYDHWAGLSETAPRRADFFLERGKEGFFGTAEFEAGGYSLVGPLTATTNLFIPFEEVQSFLKVLTEPSLQKTLQRRFLPFVTDSYPEISIIVNTGDWSVTFEYTPFERPHPEWYFFSTHPSDICQVPCLTTSDSPKRALEILDPYLKREVQKELFEEIRNRIEKLPYP